MVVLLNGSFGVGKTTVARLLRSSWAGSVVYDPEWCGLALMRLPRSVTGGRADDFQDMALWRKSVISGARLFRLFFADGYRANDDFPPRLFQRSNQRHLAF
jgi:hypothetical protein